MILIIINQVKVTHRVNVLNICASCLNVYNHLYFEPFIAARALAPVALTRLLNGALL